MSARCGGLFAGSEAASNISRTFPSMFAAWEWTWGKHRRDGIDDRCSFEACAAHDIGAFREEYTIHGQKPMMAPALNQWFSDINLLRSVSSDKFPVGVP